MKIVIIAGGTGSIALQHGLHEIAQKIDNLEIKVLVNAYDNGLSTGLVRKVFGGKILGPSDVRKNQTTRHELLHGVNTPIGKFLAHRFTIENKSVRDYVFSMLDKLTGTLSNESFMTLHDGLTTYFNNPDSIQIDYQDFSIANIVYAGLAAKYNNSLRTAATKMAKVLDIEDNVILNDDRSLFLGAVTHSGLHMSDEADIVSWNNPRDPIADVFFFDEDGNPATPTLCEEARETLKAADVIILSSGTQWSSLIPTYASTGFKSIMSAFAGKVIMIMNRVPDKDAPNQSASDLIRNIVPKYFRTGQIDLVMDRFGHDLMKSVDEDAMKKLKSVNAMALSTPHLDKESLHRPTFLGRAVVYSIFREFLDASHFMFDYDDTLVGRGNAFPKSSKLNIVALSKNRAVMSVCSGNSIKALGLSCNYIIDSRTFENNDSNNRLTVFADGGVNKYEYSTTANSEDKEVRPYTFIECLVPEATFSANTKKADQLISDLRLGGIPTTKIENRGDVMLAIKPIDPEYREITRQLVVRILANTGLLVKSAGRTSIEIANKYVTKEAAVKHMLSTLDPGENLVFVGDEFKEGGNDYCIKLLSREDSRVQCLPVKSPSDTAMFFMALDVHRFMNNF